jgi:2-polyprenyl-6-methoxyphenol hydroxylase-like FAD-dependent oxidoreductase
MTQKALSVDVLIVGAGPVGLFLANECARRGMTFRIVEMKSSQSEHSKALAVFPRTLEIFDMAGVVDGFLEKANRVNWVSMITHDRSLGRLHFEAKETPYPFVAMVPQDVTERLLAEELTKRDGAVEYDTKFVAAEQRDKDVLVTIERGGETSKVTAAYVVGCDGAHSAVRHALNLTFEGAAYSGFFLLADIETNESLPADEMQLCPSELGAVAVFPMSAQRRRIVATIDEQEGDAPSLELVRKVIAERAPKGLEARSLHWSSYFRIHHRQVRSLRDRRIFIAGDAAHIHSPFGGQGMNTGLHDVWNLVWKLDLALRARGSDELLDSYSAERLPVIKQVIRTTDFMTRFLGSPNRVVQAVRDGVIPMISRFEPFQNGFVERLSGLGIRYHGSPIIEGSGERYFREWMRGGEGMRSRFVLQHPEGDRFADELARKFAAVLETRVSEEGGVRLVRPDGYLAYSANHWDPKAVQDIRGLLEHHIALGPSSSAVV